MKKIKFIFGALLLLTMIVPVYAADTFEDALREGDLYADFRYRYEFVEQDGKAEDAKASTLRSRLGYTSGEYMNLSAGIEFEIVSLLGSDDYNDTVNGKTTYPTVADVENKEVNQAWLQYSGIDDTAIKIGRQAVKLDGERFIGDVGWRQNNQTFDALTIVNTSLEHTQIIYGYVYNINRIFGEQSTGGDLGSDSHLINISNTSLPIGKITGYGYLLDVKAGSPPNSSETYGLSLAGKVDVDDDVALKYYVEYARQGDYGENATSYDANYYHIAPAIAWGDVTTTVGYEVLGSDNGTFAFRTPLATGHKFNGWADQFLTTPNNGLEDLYIDVTYKPKDVEGMMSFVNEMILKIQYHNFSANEGSADYGKEWGIYVKKPITKNTYAEVKYADYDADTFATDVKKTTVGLGIKF